MVRSITILCKRKSLVEIFPELLELNQSLFRLIS